MPNYHKIKNVKSNNGNEYKSHEFNDYFLKMGLKIVHHSLHTKTRWCFKT